MVRVDLLQVYLVSKIFHLLGWIKTLIDQLLQLIHLLRIQYFSRCIPEYHMTTFVSSQQSVFFCIEAGTKDNVFFNAMFVKNFERYQIIHKYPSLVCCNNKIVLCYLRLAYSLISQVTQLSNYFKSLLQMSIVRCGMSIDSSPLSISTDQQQLIV